LVNTKKLCHKFLNQPISKITLTDQEIGSFPFGAANFINKNEFFGVILKVGKPKPENPESNRLICARHNVFYLTTVWLKTCQ